MKNVNEIMSAIAVLAYVYEGEVAIFVETNERIHEDVIILLDNMGAEWFEGGCFQIDNTWGYIVNEG